MTRSAFSTRQIRSSALPALALAALLASGCATTASSQGPSSAGQSGPVKDPTVATVQQQPQAYQQRSVRWGGTVAAIENREQATWIEVIERPLNRTGRPNNSRLSNGRFLAIVPQFLDPADYRAGRSITITGNIDGSDTRKIGDADYRYPKVVVADHTLWQTPTRLASGSDGYHPHHSPFRSKLSIGFGFGHRGSFGFFGSRSGYGRQRYRHGRSVYRHRGAHGRKHFRRRH